MEEGEIPCIPKEEVRGMNISMGNKEIESNGHCWGKFMSLNFPTNKCQPGGS